MREDFKKVPIRGRVKTAINIVNQQKGDDVMKKIKCILVIITLVIIISSHCYAQWAISYGGSDNDYASSIQQTSDGGYIVAGSTRSFGAGESDF